MGGYVRYRVEGLNIDRQFDKMIKSGITAKDIKRRDKKCIEFSLPVAQAKQGIDFFASECYNILTINNAVVFTFLNFLKNRWLFALCMVAMATSLFLLGGYIWRVDISGDIDTHVVKQVLEQNGLSAGVKKKGILLDEAENLICNNLPQAKYAVVSIKGSTLFVEVFKKEKPQQIIDFNDCKSIYANCDGVVSRIVVVSGTPRVNVGDVVTKGQLLIENVRTFNDGTTQPVRAVGQVFADVVYDGYSHFDGYEKVLTKTGKSKRVFNLSLFGFCTNNNVDIFANQICDVNEQTFCTLPIKITNTTVYEVVEQKQKITFDRQKHEQLAYQHLLQQVLCDKKDVTYTIEQNQDKIIVTAQVVLQKQIDTY